MAEEHGDRADLGPRSDVVPFSTFEVNVNVTESMLISLSILYQPLHGVMAPPATSTPYYSRSNQWIRRDVPSIFEVEIPASDSGSKSQLILISIVTTISSTKPFHLLFAGGAMIASSSRLTEPVVPVPSTSMSISAEPISTLYTTTRTTNVRERMYNLLIV